MDCFSLFIFFYYDICTLWGVLQQEKRFIDKVEFEVFLEKWLKQMNMSDIKAAQNIDEPKSNILTKTQMFGSKQCKIWE